MAVGKSEKGPVGKNEKGETEAEKGPGAMAAAGKGEKGSPVVRKGGKRSVVVGKGEKGPTVAEEKGKGVLLEETGKEVAYGDMITLKSSDGKPFQVSKEAAAGLSKHLAEKIAGGGCGDGGAIELENIGPDALEKVVDYCNKHHPCAAASSSRRSFYYTEASKELEEWDRDLVDRLSQDALFDLVEAADSLKMDGLLDVTCRKIADMMKDKSIAQMREMFSIENDFTKEQEEEIRQEHAWAFNV